MTVLVIDASVAVKWFIRHDDSTLAEKVLASHSELHAPDFQQAEFANAIWKYSRARLIGAEQAVAALTALPKTITFWHDTALLAPPAFELATKLDHPVYDCLYLALAIRLDGRVVTADRGFAGRVAASDYASRAIVLRDWAE